MNEAYQRLTERFRRIATIGECASMLNWDASAVMPPGGAAVRADQLALLAGLGHQTLTAPEVEADLAEAQASGPWDEANLRLMRHGWRRAKAVPEDLVVALAKASSHCEKLWRTARETSDFALVLSNLAEVLNLTRQSAQALAEALHLSP